VLFIFWGRHIAKIKQEKLNAIQLELDREKKKNRELAEAAAIKDEQIKILQNILQENDSHPAAADEDEVTKAKKPGYFVCIRIWEFPKPKSYTLASFTILKLPF
jgi:hypothetical protein